MVLCRGDDVVGVVSSGDCGYWCGDSEDGGKGGFWCGDDVGLSHFYLTIFSRTFP